VATMESAQTRRGNKKPPLIRDFHSRRFLHKLSDGASAITLLVPLWQAAGETSRFRRGVRRSDKEPRPCSRGQAVATALSTIAGRSTQPIQS
jgi:hypothetical protein